MMGAFDGVDRLAAERARERAFEVTRDPQLAPDQDGPAGVEVVDMGWGDLRLKDSPNTRVTQDQVDAMVRLGAIEAGASEVRFGSMVGELLVQLADGRWCTIGVDGFVDDVTKEVMG